jgi:hypothetical protein
MTIEDFNLRELDEVAEAWGRAPGGKLLSGYVQGTDDHTFLCVTKTGRDYRIEASWPTSSEEPGEAVGCDCPFPDRPHAYTRVVRESAREAAADVAGAIEAIPRGAALDFGDGAPRHWRPRESFK